MTKEPSCKDEARVGRKNKITRRWAKRGTRSSAPRDQRTVSAYIFGAICPAEGKGAGLVLPSCNSEAMALHLEEISLAVAPGAHALVLTDQAGWHVSKKLPVPGNITLIPLPPKSPELNPVENIFSCATTGSRTGSSNPTTTSSITVVSPGTSLSRCPGKLCLSEFENGPIGLDQADLVSVIPMRQTTESSVLWSETCALGKKSPAPDRISSTPTPPVIVPCAVSAFPLLVKRQDKTWPEYRQRLS